MVAENYITASQSEAAMNTKLKITSRKKTIYFAFTNSYKVEFSIDPKKAKVVSQPVKAVMDRQSFRPTTIQRTSFMSAAFISSPSLFYRNRPQRIAVTNNLSSAEGERLGWPTCAQVRFKPSTWGSYRDAKPDVERIRQRNQSKRSNYMRRNWSQDHVISVSWRPSVVVESCNKGHGFMRPQR